MPNGELLKELREIVTEDRQISSKTASRLTLSGMLEMLNSQEKIEAELKGLRENPMVWIGSLMRRHPKPSIAGLITFLVILLGPHAVQAYIFGKAILEEYLGLPSGILP